MSRNGCVPQKLKCEFHVIFTLWNIIILLIFSQPCNTVKTILRLPAIQKQTADEIWPVGCSLSTNPRSKPTNSFCDFNHQTLYMFEEFNMKEKSPAFKKISANSLFLICNGPSRQTNSAVEMPCIMPRKHRAQRRTQSKFSPWHFRTISRNVDATVTPPRVKGH